MMKTIMVMHSTRPATHPITIPTTPEDELLLPISSSLEASCDSMGVVEVMALVVVVTGVNDVIMDIADVTILDIKEVVLVVATAAAVADGITDVVTGVTDVVMSEIPIHIHTQLHHYMLVSLFNI